MRTAFRSEESNVRHVMVSTRVGATADVDPNAGHLGQTVGFECLSDRCGEPSRLRDGKTARVGTRARHNVSGELCAWLGHLEFPESFVELGKLRVNEASENEVLPIRRPDLDVEVAHD